VWTTSQKHGIKNQDPSVWTAAKMTEKTNKKQKQSGDWKVEVWLDDKTN
jgi:hypothetical protein